MMRPERGGKTFSLAAIATLRESWTGRHSVDIAHKTLLDAGYVLSRDQVLEGARRYCVDGARPPAPAPEPPPPQPTFVLEPSLVDFTFTPRRREDNKVRLVEPGTHRVPVGGYKLGTTLR